MPDALIIVNPAARAGRPQPQLVDAAIASLRNRGFRVEVQVTAGAGHAAQVAQSCRAELVIVAGGDGTVNEVASGLLQNAHGTPTLGILPAGTGNDVARLLGLRAPEAALAALRGDRVVIWDVIEIDCQHVHSRALQHALLFAGAGFVGEVIRQTTTVVKSWCGPRLSYAVGFFRALVRFRSVHLHVSGPGMDHDGPLLAALAANAPHAGGGGMHVGPGAQMDDGQFDVSVIRSVNRVQVARQFVRLLRGTHVRHHAVTYFPSTWLEIDARQPIDVVADGEVVGTTPARFTLRPKALRLYSG